MYKTYHNKTLSKHYHNKKLYITLRIHNVIFEYSMLYCGELSKKKTTKCVIVLSENQS